MGKLTSLGLWWIVERSFSSVGTEYWISRINSDGAVVRDSGNDPELSPGDGWLRY